MDAGQLQDELVELQGKYNDSLTKIEELQIKHKIEVAALEKEKKANHDLQKDKEMLEKAIQDLEKKVQEMKLEAEVANKLKQTPLPEGEKKKPTEARPLGPYGRPTKASLYRQKFNNQK